MTASSSSQEEDVDNSVPLLAPITFGKKKKIQFSKGASTSTSLNSKETIKGSKRKNVGDSGCVVASGSSGSSSGSSHSSMSSKAAVPSGSYKFSFSKKTAATKPNDNLNKTILIPDSDSDVDEVSFFVVFKIRQNWLFSIKLFCSRNPFATTCQE